MKREHFVKVVEEVLDSLPQEFRSRIRNVVWWRICRRTSHHRSRAAKAAASGSLPWRAHDQEERI